MSDRKSMIMQAILRVEEDDYTAAGMPSVDAINLIIQSDGHDEQPAPVTAKERDEIWLELTEQPDPEKEAPAAIAVAEVAEPEPEAAPEAESGALVNVTITEAQSDPVTVYVHGRGSFSLRVGFPGDIPMEGLQALRNSDAKFKENEQ